MSGGKQTERPVSWFWPDQYEMTLQVVGLVDPVVPCIRRDLEGKRMIVFQLAKDGTLCSASGIGVGNAVSKDIRLAEMLMERRATPAPKDLSDPGVNLKHVLRR
jgi:3-phenylpropionate/trans-cinnamate dioxygenase ferredoxin reductase subunit